MLIASNFLLDNIQYCHDHDILLICQLLIVIIAMSVIECIKLKESSMFSYS